ncbi:MAG: hypothetical protein ACE5MM_01020, partial [Nitrospiraceae bacterium]
AMVEELPPWRLYASRSFPNSLKTKASGKSDASSYRARRFFPAIVEKQAPLPSCSHRMRTPA